MPLGLYHGCLRVPYVVNVEPAFSYIPVSVCIAAAKHHYAYRQHTACYKLVQERCAWDFHQIATPKRVSARCYFQHKAVASLQTFHI